MEAAVRFVDALVERIGPIRLEEGVPREIRRQQWSVLNVPSMWSAAEGNQECAILEWLVSFAEGMPPIQIFRGVVHGTQAARSGWEPLHGAMRSMGIHNQEGLSDWIHNQGFRQPGWGGHFSGRAQERMLTAAAAIDANVALLETLFVHIVLQACGTSVH